MTRPFILITNDDGIHADGMKHLSNALYDFADVAIVAPLTEKSGAGLGITWTTPLVITEVPWAHGIAAWSVTGTPADCVKMALKVLFQRKPDLIVSGVNRGSNSGQTVLYSGTVGGVIEGTLQNIPGIAFSFSDLEFPPVETSKQPIASLVKYFLAHPFPPGAFLNVNFPFKFDREMKGFRMARQGRGYWAENPERRIHPDGLPYYWLGGKWLSFEEAPDSDVALLEAGYLTAAPIQVGELTDFKMLEKHKDSIQEIYLKMRSTASA